MKRSNIFLRASWITVSRLFGGLFAGLFLGTALFHLLPGSSVESPTAMHSAIAALPALGGFLAGGWLWGTEMGRLAGAADNRRAAWSGLLGFGPVTLVLAVGLSFLEPVLVANYGRVLPIHRLFTVLFVGSAFLIAAVSTWSLGRAIQKPGEALRTGLTAAGAFLLTNLTMEASGWVVGAPGASERATMLVVMFTSNLVAAVAAGGVLGLTLRQGETVASPTITSGDPRSTGS